MNLNEYQSLLDQLQELRYERSEIRDKIDNSGYPSNILTDMPRGGRNDRLEILADLWDTESIICAEISIIQVQIQRSRRKLEKYIKEIKCPQKRLVLRLKYIDGLTTNEILEETGKSYWAVKRLLNNGGAEN